MRKTFHVLQIDDVGAAMSALMIHGFVEVVENLSDHVNKDECVIHEKPFCV